MAVSPEAAKSSIRQSQFTVRVNRSDCLHALRVDTDFHPPYTTSLMAKSDFTGMSGTRSGSATRKSWIYWTLAALVLIAGYADLIRGGETLAPILLIVGYCVLVPLAILG